MRSAAALILAAGVLLGACGDDGGEDVSSGGTGAVDPGSVGHGPDTQPPVLVDPLPVDPGGGIGGAGGGGRLVEPTPGLVGVVPTAIDSYTVVDDTTLEVTFFTGVEECYGLEKITVDEADDRVTLTVHTGSRPDAEVCIEIAEQVRAAVTLAAPLGERTVIDGSTGQPVPGR